MSRRGAAAALPQVEAPLADVPLASFAWLATEAITESESNPRGRPDKEALAELIGSVRVQGILQPVLVRPLGGERYELVAGHRRLAAARAVGLATVPATVRDLTDTEVLEIQLLENLHRADLTPLEEARGYARLAKAPGYDVAKVAEKVGRSVAYVYARMKLLALSKDAQALLATGRLTAGHAILLARLSPADQARALTEGAALQREELRFTLTEDEEPAEAPLKAVSVRELAGWIDRNVRLEPEAVDPVLFPEAAAAVEAAPKVVSITHLHYVPEEARAGKTYFPQSWKRADGREDSKICEHATLGFVAVGPHRGEAFEVCIAKDRCTTHWGAEIRERRKRATERATAGGAEPAKKADSPEAARNREALERALTAARGAAAEEIIRAAGEAAAKATPEGFLRCLALSRDSDLVRVLRAAGESVKTDADAQRWIHKAPIAQVQRALARAELDYAQAELCGALGVDEKAIFARHEQAAREAHRVQTSAKAKHPAAAKPGRKAKG